MLALPNRAWNDGAMKCGPKLFQWQARRVRCMALAALLGFLLTACKDRDESVDVPAAQVREFSRRTVEIRDGSPVRERGEPLRASEDILPGASEVRSALERGEYSDAVDSLLALRGASTEGRKYTEYLTLYGEVADSLRGRARSDERAAEALKRFDALARRE